MAVMDENWGRVADEIRAELTRKGWSQSDLAAAAGVSDRTVSRLVDGRPHRGIPPKAYRVQEALGWPSGRIRDLLEGRGISDEYEHVPMSEVVEELLEHLDWAVAQTRGRRRRGYEEQARIIRARLARFRNGDGHDRRTEE